MAKTTQNIFNLSLLCFLVFVKPFSCETDKLQQGQHLKDGQELVSAFRIFKLGFFSPGSSRNRYLGIRYNNYYLNGGREYGDLRDKVVWVADRNNPIPDLSGSLTIDSLGKLKISRRAMALVELSPIETTGNTTLTLLDSGNLVLQEMNPDGSEKRLLWQSFDFPTDTLLPGMKLGMNTKTGKKWELTSWLNDDFPASGSFSFGVDPNITNRLIASWLGDIYWMSGLWFEKSFTSQFEFFNFSFVPNENETYFRFNGYWPNDVMFPRIANTWRNDIMFPRIANTLRNDIMLPRITITPRGDIYLISLTEERVYASCSTPDYRRGEKNVGCGEQKSPRCRGWWTRPIKKRGFMYGDGLVFNETKKLSLYDCFMKCYRNCSCIAYSSTNEDDIGCQIWSRKGSSFNESSANQSRYIFFMEFNRPYEDAGNRETWLIVLASVVLTILVLGLFLYVILRKYKLKAVSIIGLLLNFIWREVVPRVISAFCSMLAVTSAWLRNLRANAMTDQEVLLHELGIDTRRRRWQSRRKDHELQFLRFDSVSLASGNFSDANKLGEGGFGLVYKGKLPDGQEVAIKRLSRGSGQGLVEFKNEVTLIAKLQHNNLVRLVGCCIEKEEKILIYEYMPNKSLDSFLFDPLKRSILDWKMRFNIIEGIVQGLLYLHKYSRLRVIHRDIKASNILLDEDMNPKISDFGMARTFGAQESKANTKRVAGTYGYMSPEYAAEGIFSTKSDVFSFGVLLLEIISGRKNNSFQNSEGPLTLIGYAWELWREGRDWELIDPTLGDAPYENAEILKCLHVALLCVQGNPTDRPSMLDVVSMIYSEGNVLPSPNQPAFYNVNCRNSPAMETAQPENFSTNRATVTEMEAR